MAAEPRLPDAPHALPHGTVVSGSRMVERPGRDLAIIAEAGSVIVHCPLVSGRHGGAIDISAAIGPWVCGWGSAPTRRLPTW